jgi:hypothetical protein
MKYPTLKEVAEYEMLLELLISIISEMKEFSKKKPDEPLNKNKVKIINRTLTPIKELLKSQPTIGFLDLLDEELLPSNSDAVLMTGQFHAAMKQFKDKYYGMDGYSRRWFTEEQPPN